MDGGNGDGDGPADRDRRQRAPTGRAPAARALVRDRRSPAPLDEERRGARDRGRGAAVLERRLRARPPVSDSVDRSVARADTVGSWWTPARWVLLTATLVYLLGVSVAAALPDHRGRSEPGQLPLDVLLRHRDPLPAPRVDAGQRALPRQRQLPVLEYPVLTGWFLSSSGGSARALGAPTGSELTAQQQVDSTLIFIDVNIVMLGALLLVAVWAQVGTVPHRPWDAMMLAASPCVAATALINWDLLAGRADRAGRAVLVPPSSRLGRCVLGARDGGEAVSAVPARTAVVPVPAGRPDAGVRPDAGGVRGRVAGDEPARAVAGARQLAELLDLQLRPVRRPRLDLVRAVAGRAPGRRAELAGPGDLRVDVRRDRRL